MARPLFHPGISVHLLVTVLWLWHGGTAVLAQEPSPVSLLTVISRNESSLTLEWTVPSDTNQTLYRYEVKWSVLGDTSNQTFPSRGNTSTVQTEVLAGLSPGVSYNITVFSLSPSGDRSNGTSLANATTSPSPATSLTVTARNDTSLTLQWTVPNDTNHDSYSYQVWVGPTRNENFTSNTIGGKQTVVIGGLLPGVTYNLTVFSCTSDGILSTSSNLANQTTSPSPVTSLTVTARNDTSLTLQWTVPNNTNQGSYSYQVWVGSTRIENFTSNAIGGKQTVVIGGLLPGVTYNLTVYSRTSDGILSTSSNLANQTTSPSPVTSLTVTARNDTSLTLQWTVPNNTNQGSYSYQVWVGSTRIENFTSNAIGGKQTVVIGGLLPGVTYNLTVYSRTSDGILSTSSNLANQTTSPSPVTSLTVTARNDTSLTLQWTVPNNTNQGSYSYQVWVGSTRIENFTSNAIGGKQTVVIGGLLPGVTYNLTVYSRTSDGILSTSSNLANQTTSPSPVTSLTVTARNDTSLTLQWTVPNNTNQGSYSYQVWVGSTRIENFTSNAIGGKQTVVIGGLLPGVTYNLTVYSRTSDGILSTSSNLANQTTSPSPVTSLTVTARNDTSLTLQWTVPNNTNQGSYSYQVWVGSTRIENFTSNAIGGKQTVVIGGLLPGVTYNLTVYSRTSDGILSTSSNLANQTTSPSPVTSLTVTARNDTSLTLQWTVPNNTNQGSYSYQVWVGSTRIENFTSNAIGGKQTVVIGGLLPGVTYNLTVYSRTSDGILSTSSNLANQTTSPSPVTSLTVTARNDTSLTLQWTVPNNTNQGSYSYQVWVGSTRIENFTSNAIGGKQTVVIGGLLPGVTYNLTVYSRTSDGILSTSSNLANQTTSPSPVTSLTVTARNDTSLTLQWTVPNNSNQGSYSYQVWVGPTRNENFTSNTIGGKQTVVIGGLLPGVTYNLTVYSRTSDGILSTSSNLANQTTSPSPVTSLTVTARNDTSLTLQWTVPNNTNQGSYSYQVWVGSTRIENFTSNAIGGKQTVVIGGLLPGVTYNLTVYSRTSDGILSTSSNLANQTTNPNPPENLMGSPSNDTAILVNWTAPPDPNANNYNYTALLYNIKNAGENHTYTTSADSTSFTSLFPGNLYLVSVISQIGNAISIPSQTYAQTNPQTVNSLTPPVITNTTATFTWDLDLQNMSELSEFQIKAILQNGTTDTQPINSSLRNYTFMNLIPGTNYTFEFRSVRTSNAQPLSSRRRRQIDTSLVTYSRAIVQYAQTDPGTVYAIQCTVLNGGYTLGVKWDCPQGAFTQFKVLVNDKENKAVNKCEGVTVTNLQPASDYKISVQTIAGLKAVTSFPEKCKTDATGVIVGAIFGVLLFLVLIALIIFFVLKRRRANGGSGSGRSVSMRRFPVNIPVDKFPAYFRQQHADSDFGFAEEYQLLGPIGTDQVQTAAQQFENKSKNRYTNVLPYDISRVKLHSLLGDPNSDYINANYMPGYNSNKEFIATQGPLPTTIGDFWRMVWEHRVGTMVMLTNCTEGGKLKCEHYWPLDYTPCTYDDITVAVTSETILPQWTTREFTLRHAKESGIRYVSHFHYTVWPDHGVPAETATVIRFRNMVREHMDDRKSNGPAIVHCSAGVGRTGTLIALDYLMQQVENEKVVGIFNFIKKMRLNRPFMVQTESQYIFLNQCMLDVIEHPNTEMENIYENQIAGDLIYENFDAMKQYGKPNGKLA